MAIKKSELYSSLWQSCDELRGGMDASQYKDYVLFMLFIKYVSDKYGDSDDFSPPVTIPAGASFQDMIALKGKSDIGDKINTQIIQPLIDANSRLARTDFPDFNDPNKLGEGKAMVDRLTNLVGIFQKPELDFSQHRADNDDQQAELETVAATKTELEEEHGGEEGALKDVSTKGDAQTAHTQAIVALWNDEDKPACAAYLALTESAKAHATILSDMDAEIAALETKLAKARQVKQGMMQELLTGNIRLI